MKATMARDFARPLSLEDVDEILVLERGRIAERGTHEELLSGRGLYGELFEVQPEVLVPS